MSSEWALNDVTAVPVRERRRRQADAAARGTQPPAKDIGGHREPQEADAPATLCRGHSPADVEVPAQ